MKEEMKNAVKEEIEKGGGEITLESKDDLGMLYGEGSYDWLNKIDPHLVHRQLLPCA